jgi:hypothetical protein
MPRRFLISGVFSPLALRPVETCGKEVILNNGGYKLRSLFQKEECARTKIGETAGKNQDNSRERKRPKHDRAF